MRMRADVIRIAVAIAIAQGVLIVSPAEAAWLDYAALRIEEEPGYWLDEELIRNGFSARLESCGGVLCFGLGVRYAVVPYDDADVPEEDGEILPNMFPSVGPVLGISLMNDTVVDQRDWLRPAVVWGLDLGPSVNVNYDHPRDRAVGIFGTAHVGAGFATDMAVFTAGIGVGADSRESGEVEILLPVSLRLLL